MPPRESTKRVDYNMDIQRVPRELKEKIIKEHHKDCANRRLKRSRDPGVQHRAQEYRRKEIEKDEELEILKRTLARMDTELKTLKKV